jgi:hypothetical protein
LQGSGRDRQIPAGTYAAALDAVGALTLAMRRGGLLLRVAAAGCGANGRNEEGAGSGRCGARGGDRFARAMISLALDEVDAAEAPDRRLEASVTPELSPTSPGDRITAVGIARAVAKLAIAFAAKRLSAAVGAVRDPVTESTRRRSQHRRRKRSQGAHCVGHGRFAPPRDRIHAKGIVTGGGAGPEVAARTPGSHATPLRPRA